MRKSLALILALACTIALCACSINVPNISTAESIIEDIAENAAETPTPIATESTIADERANEKIKSYKNIDTVDGESHKGIIEIDTENNTYVWYFEGKKDAPFKNGPCYFNDANGMVTLAFKRLEDTYYFSEDFLGTYVTSMDQVQTYNNGTCIEFEATASEADGQVLKEYRFFKNGTFKISFAVKTDEGEESWYLSSYGDYSIDNDKGLIEYIPDSSVVSEKGVKQIDGKVNYLYMASDDKIYTDVFLRCDSADENQTDVVDEADGMDKESNADEPVNDVSSETDEYEDLKSLDMHDYVDCEEIWGYDELTLENAFFDAYPIVYQDYDVTIYSDGEIYTMLDYTNHTISLAFIKKAKEIVGYSDDELMSMALNYYLAHNEFYGTPISSMIDGGDDDTVLIRIFENHPSHIATLDWYSVSRATGKGTDDKGNEIDITSVE